MREIKFRFWSIQAKQWAGFNEFAGELHCDRGSYPWVWSLTNPEFEKFFVPCRFTGLKDKTGKEIYEDDIVEFDNTLMRVDFWREKCQFIFYQRGWQETHDISSDSVVIGNIHENPELLKPLRDIPL